MSAAGKKEDRDGFVFASAAYPAGPGVYLMKDASGRIIYVGKAKSLRKRLASYFGDPARLTPKTRAMVGRIASIDTLLAGSEKEALLLEASLIKKHKPRYNVILRDDKSYVLFKLTKSHAFPRLVLTRKVARDGASYFGPYCSAADARRTMRAITAAFGLRVCPDHGFANRSRPCLYHHIGRCPAPCVGLVDQDAYARGVRQAEMVLSGRAGELLGRLKKAMRKASDELRFEEAAEHRDRIRAVEATVERQAAVLPGGGDADVLGVARTGAGLGLGLLFVRGGRLTDQAGFHFPGQGRDEALEVLESFLIQHYGPGRYIPPRIVLPRVVNDPALAEALAERRGGPVKLDTPAGSAEKRLVELARNVAAEASAKDKNLEFGEALARRLKLDRTPERIECVDASHLAGKGMRVGQVVYEHFRPSPGEYRIYAFEDLNSGDDYAALKSWAERRAKSGGPWPDLVLVDGGKGQLAAVAAGFEQGGAPESVALAAIAKGPSRRAGELEDKVFRPGRKNPLNLAPGSGELLFLQKMRDAAHRFTISRQRKARSKTALSSRVQSLPGVGPKTARLLWDRFGSLERMAKATEQELALLPGMGPKKAQTLAKSLADLDDS